MSVTNGATDPALPQATSPEEWVIERDDRETEALVLYIEAGMKDAKLKVADGGEGVTNYLEFSVVGTFYPNVTTRVVQHYRDVGWKAVDLVGAQGSATTIVTLVFP